jgi:hypothetical protein
MEPTRYICARIKKTVTPDETPTVISIHGHVWAESEAEATRMLYASRPTIIARPAGRPMRDTELRMVPADVLAQWMPEATSTVAVAPSGFNAE